MPPPEASPDTSPPKRVKASTTEKMEKMVEKKAEQAEKTAKTMEAFTGEDSDLEDKRAGELVGKAALRLFKSIKKSQDEVASLPSTSIISVPPISCTLQ